MEEKTNPYINPEELSVIELIHFVSDNKLDKDPRIKALLTSLAHNPADKERKAQLVRMIKPKIMSNLVSPNPFKPYPEDDEVAGELKLGVCADTSAPFGLNFNELMQGTLIAGRPGSGKTTLTYNIIQRANEFGIHCLILDIKKDYRHLIRKLPNTFVFRADSDNFKWNPLQIPKGVDRISHISNFADITSETYYVQDGTNSYIVEHLSRLYDTLEQPTLINLYDAMKEEKQALITRTARYRESALNRLASIIVKMGRAFSHRKGYRVEEMLDDYNITVEIDNLGTKGSIYLSSLILSHVFQYRIANNLRGDKEKPVLVIIDEGNEIFDRNLEKQFGSLTLTSMAREAREFKLGLVVSCQIPDAISDSVKNVYTRVLMSLPEGGNLKNFALSMGLTKEQQECNYSLAPGQAIIRLAGRYDKPFLAQFIDYPLEKNVSNEEIKEHMNSLLAGLDEKYCLKEQEEETKPASKAEELTEDEKRFLIDVYNRPFLNQEERAKALEISNTLIERIGYNIEKKDLGKILKIHFGGRGSSCKYIAFTKKGFEAIGMKPDFKINKSNFEHSCWQDKIAKHFEKDCKVEKEKILRAKGRKKSIDVALETESGIIAVEVAMTSAYEKKNIIRDLEAGCIRVIVACKNKKVLEEVNVLIAGLVPEKQSKAKACLLTEIIKLSLKEI